MAQGNVNLQIKVDSGLWEEVQNFFGTYNDQETFDLLLTSYAELVVAHQTLVQELNKQGEANGKN